jgi:hypothetical protein
MDWTNIVIPWVDWIHAKAIEFFIHERVTYSVADDTSA